PLASPPLARRRPGGAARGARSRPPAGRIRAEARGALRGDRAANAFDGGGSGNPPDSRGEWFRSLAGRVACLGGVRQAPGGRTPRSAPHEVGGSGALRTNLQGRRRVAEVRARKAAR